MTALVLRKDADRTAILELNQPARGNALSGGMVRALRSELDKLFSDQNFDTVVISGAGRNLCTGFDLDGIEEQSDGDVLQRFVEIELLLSDLWHSPIRTIAFAKGKTWGAGADVFAACDFRIAQANATFRFPGAGFGIVLGTRRLSERVGETAARRWVSGNEEIIAADAISAGLATDLTVLDVAEWVESELPKSRVARNVLDDLYRASRMDFRDKDLAYLVRSAVAPGLRDRIVAYAKRTRAVAKPSRPEASDA